MNRNNILKYGSIILLILIYDWMAVNIILIPNMKIYILTVGITAFIFSLVNPKISLIMYVFSVFTLLWLTDARVPLSFLPRWVGYVADLLLINLVFAAIARQILIKEKTKPTVYDLLIAILFAATLLSWSINSVPTFTAFGGLRFIMVMVSGYFVLRYGDLDKQFIQKLFYILIFISIIQFPLTIFQRIIGVEFFGWGPDMVAGTFRRYTGLVTFQTMIIAISIAAFLTRGLSYKIKRILLIAGTFAFFSLSLSNSRMVWLELPLIVMIVVITKHGIKSIRMIKYFAVFGLIYIIGLSSFEFLYGGAGNQSVGAMRFLTDPKSAYRYMFIDKTTGEGVRLQRGAAILYVAQHINESDGGWIFGLGPGMMTEFKYDFAVSKYTKLFQELRANIVQVSTFLGEWGLIGLITSFLLTFVGLKFRRRYKRQKVPGLSDVIYTAYPAIVIHFFLMQFYGRVWFENDSSFIFWFFTIYMIFEVESQKNTILKPQIT